MPILAKWKQRPVPLYAPAFTNTNGLDYQAAAHQAANEWMDATGVPLFKIVDTPQEPGIVLSYPNYEVIAPFRGVTYYTNGPDGHPLKDEVFISNDFSDSTLLFKVMLHEIGHTIRFGHMTDRQFIMYGGQPLPPGISEDEITLTILHAGLPTRVDMSIYDHSIPTR